MTTETSSASAQEVSAYLASAVGSARNAYDDFKAELADGFQWRDIAAVKAQIVRAIIKATGTAIRANRLSKTDAKAVVVTAWERLVDDYFDETWDALWFRLPGLVRWIPGVKGSLGRFLKRHALEAGDTLIEAAIKVAHDAGKILG